jgi:tripartite-type tricarboxylate transporter receptor subunit TctC
VIERLYRMVSAALSKDAVRASMMKQGIPAALKTPAEISAMLPREVEKWAAVIRTAHLAME